jgi:hypothetical protein
MELADSGHDSGEVVFEPRLWKSKTMPRLTPLAVADVVLVILGLSTGSAGDFTAAGVLVAWILLLLWIDTRTPVQAPVRMDAAGVSWADADQTLAWSAVDHGIIRRRARVWRLFGVFGSVGLVDKSAAAFAARAASRPTVQLITCRDVDADAEEVTAVIQRFAPQIPFGHTWQPRS